MKLDGTWNPIEAHLNGELLPEDIISSMTLSVTGDKYVVKVGNEPDKGTIKYYPYSIPMGLDIIGEEGPNKGKTIKAIYKHTGGYLFICYNLYSEERPKNFTSTPQNKYYLVRYKLVQ